ncbi:MAG: hypothetical protein ACO3YN_03695 [Rubrivivax sp.]
MKVLNFRRGAPKSQVSVPDLTRPSDQAWKTPILLTVEPGASRIAQPTPIEGVIR